MAAAKFPENSLIKPRYRWAHRQVDSARGGATCRVAGDCQLSVSAGTVGDNKCDNWSQESFDKNNGGIWTVWQESCRTIAFKLSK